MDDAWIRVAARPISPHYGKPVVTGAFGSATWIGDMTAWITGEAEFVTVRLADGWNVYKRYDLASSGDLEIALHELAALIAEGSVPDEAVTAWVTRGRVARSSARSPAKRTKDSMRGRPEKSMSGMLYLPHFMTAEIKLSTRASGVPQLFIQDTDVRSRSRR